MAIISTKNNWLQSAGWTCSQEHSKREQVFPHSVAHIYRLPLEKLENTQFLYIKQLRMTGKKSPVSETLPKSVCIKGQCLFQGPQEQLFPARPLTSIKGFFNKPSQHSVELPKGTRKYASRTIYSCLSLLFILYIYFLLNYVAALTFLECLCD